MLSLCFGVYIIDIFACIVLDSTTAAQATISGSAACDQHFVDDAIANTFVVGRDFKLAPLRVHQDVPLAFHYRKHTSVYVFTMLCLCYVLFV